MTVSKLRISGNIAGTVGKEIMEKVGYAVKLHLCLK